MAERLSEQYRRYAEQAEWMATRAKDPKKQRAYRNGAARWRALEADAKRREAAGG